MLSSDHACNNNHMKILLEYGLLMLYLVMHKIKHAITISSVQDACLEHAGVLVTSKYLQEIILPPFPIKII